MTKISEYFQNVPDWREQHKVKHKLILLIGLCTYLSNGEDYEDMVIFAKTKGGLLPDLLSLSNGVPSHDTFNRVFQVLDCQILRDFLSAHGKEIADVLAEKQICLDGKKLGGTDPCGRGNRGLYIVNAWVAENRLCVGQEKVNDKSNELDALPRVTRSLDITDAVVSIDAMGCHKQIASQIKQQDGHYLLALKKNQKELFEEVVCAFKANSPQCTQEEWEYGRARFETRKCGVLSAQATMDKDVIAQWDGLQTLLKVESSRTVAGRKTTETRYYISDENEADALYYNRLVRGHWGIENHLHWHLDVTFREDDCRARKGNAPENLATLRKLALQIITQHDDKLSLKKRRVKAAYDTEYMIELLS
ncbi:MAG: ISAs1 family transposase [Cytophagales bacterium]|nr:ISAs1 family transposase [Cytophagales bacterium]